MGTYYIFKVTKRAEMPNSARSSGGCHWIRPRNSAEWTPNIRAELEPVYGGLLRILELAIAAAATEHGVHSLARLSRDWLGFRHSLQPSSLDSPARNLDSTQRGAFHRVGLIPAFRASSCV